MSELREVFEMVTKQMGPDVDAWREQEKRQRRTRRNRKWGALAIAAAIGVAAVVVILATQSEQNDATPASESAPPNGTNPTTEEIAMGFLGAYGAFDAEQAITYLSDDADITGLISSVGTQGVLGTHEELRLLFSHLEAVRFQRYVSQPCKVSSSDSGTRLHCAFDFHLLGSSELRPEPFGGSYIDLTVRDGEIVRASQYFETEEFSHQMWEPFAAWVSSNYPEDVPLMYEDETFGGVQLTEESIRLWRERTREYVEEVIATYGPQPASVGTHTRVVDGISISFDVPTPAWEQFGTISINKSTVGSQGAEAIIFWTSFPDGGNADPCAESLSEAIGPTAADLAVAVSTAPGTELLAGPSDVTVGGLPAKHVVLTIREDLGCDPGYFYFWQDVVGGALWPVTDVGDTIRVWIVDVGATRLFIEAETTDQAGTDLEQEIQQIVGSIRFG